MRLQWLAVALVSAMTAVAMADELPPAQQDQAVDGETQNRASYAFGYSMGRNISESFRVQSVAITLESLMKGFRDAMEGKEPAYSDDQLRKAVDDHRRASLTKLAKKNKEEGEAFLKENAEKEGVVTLDSGLQYQVLKRGNGPTPGPMDRITAHYRGTLIDGTVFDSSIDRNEPISIGVNEVIPGWTEALQLMKVGDKWRLFVPPELAYGRDGGGEVIGPNAVLIFDIELLAVQPGGRGTLPRRTN